MLKIILNVIKVLEIRFFIIIIFSNLIIGCNYISPTKITKQELLYKYSEKNKKFKVTLNTKFEINKKSKDDRFFILFENDKIELQQNNKIKSEYALHFKMEQNDFGDSAFVKKIKNSQIINLENKKVSKSEHYKFEIKTTLWIGNDKESPYVKF